MESRTPPGSDSPRNKVSRALLSLADYNNKGSTEHRHAPPIRPRKEPMRMQINHAYPCNDTVMISTEPEVRPCYGALYCRPRPHFLLCWVV